MPRGLEEARVQTLETGGKARSPTAGLTSLCVHFMWVQGEAESRPSGVSWEPSESACLGGSSQHRGSLRPVSRQHC